MRGVSGPAGSVRIRPDSARFGPIWATRGLRGPIGEPVLGHVARFALLWAAGAFAPAFRPKQQSRLLPQPGGFEGSDGADFYFPTPSGTMRTPRSYQLPTGTSAIRTSVSLRKLSPLTPTTASISPSASCSRSSAENTPSSSRASMSGIVPPPLVGYRPPADDPLC